MGILRFATFSRSDLYPSSRIQTLIFPILKDEFAVDISTLEGKAKGAIAFEFSMIGAKKARQIVIKLSDAMRRIHPQSLFKFSWDSQGIDDFDPLL